MKLWLCVAGPQRAWGEVTILSEYWHTTPRVLVHCPRVLSEYSQSTATVLPEYWCSTPRVLAQHSLEQCHSTTRVLVQYSKSTGTVLPEHLGSAHPRVLTQHKRPTPEYSQSEPTLVPEQPHCTDFSTVLVQSQTTNPTKKHQPATTQSTRNTEIDNVAPHTSKHRDSKHLHSAVKWP